MHYVWVTQSVVEIEGLVVSSRKLVLIQNIYAFFITVIAFPEQKFNQRL